MFDLPEKVTVWNATGGSGYDGFTWSPPLVINSRHAFRSKKVVSANGAEVMSDTAVYFTDTTVKLDSKIFIGESAELSPPSKAKDVINFASTPSGTNLRVAYL